MSANGTDSNRFFKSTVTVTVFFQNTAAVSDLQKNHLGRTTGGDLHQKSNRSPFFPNPSVTTPHTFSSHASSTNPSNGTATKVGEREIYSGPVCWDATRACKSQKDMKAQNYHESPSSRLGRRPVPTPEMKKDNLVARFSTLPPSRFPPLPLARHGSRRFDFFHSYRS